MSESIHHKLDVDQSGNIDGKDLHIALKKVENDPKARGQVMVNFGRQLYDIMRKGEKAPYAIKPYEAEILKIYVKHYNYLKENNLIPEKFTKGRMKDMLDKVVSRFEKSKKVAEKVSEFVGDLQGKLTKYLRLDGKLRSNELSNVRKLYLQAQRENTSKMGDNFDDNVLLANLREDFHIDKKFVALQKAIDSGTVKDEASMKNFFKEQKWGEDTVLAMQLYNLLTKQAVQKGKRKNERWLDGKIGPLTSASFFEHCKNTVGSLTKKGKAVDQNKLNLEQKREDLTIENPKDYDLLAQKIKVANIAISAYTNFVETSYNNIRFKWFKSSDNQVKRSLQKVQKRQKIFDDYNKRLQNEPEGERQVLTQKDLKEYNNVIDQVFFDHYNSKKGGENISEKIQDALGQGILGPMGGIFSNASNAINAILDKEQTQTLKEIKKLLKNQDKLDNDGMKKFQFTLHRLLRKLDGSQGSLYWNTSGNTDIVKENVKDIMKNSDNTSVKKSFEAINKAMKDKDFESTMLSMVKNSNKDGLTTLISNSLKTASLGSSTDWNWLGMGQDYGADYIADTMMKKYTSLEENKNSIKKNRQDSLQKELDRKIAWEIERNTDPSMTSYEKNAVKKVISDKYAITATQKQMEADSFYDSIVLEHGMMSNFQDRAMHAVLQNNTDEIYAQEGKNTHEANVLTDFAKMQGIGKYFSDDTKNRSVDFAIGAATEIAASMLTFGIGGAAISAIKRSASLMRYANRVGKIPGMVTKFPGLRRFAGGKLDDVIHNANIGLAKGVGYNFGTNMIRTIVSKEDINSLGEFGQAFAKKLTLKGIILDSAALGLCAKFDAIHKAGKIPDTFILNSSTIALLGEELSINLAEFGIASLTGTKFTLEDFMENLAMGFAFGSGMNMFGKNAEGEVTIDGRTIDQHTNNHTPQNVQKVHDSGRTPAKNAPHRNISPGDAPGAPIGGLERVEQAAYKKEMRDGIMLLNNFPLEGTPLIMQKFAAGEIKTKADMILVQKVIGTKEDGIFGPKSLKALQIYITKHIEKPGNIYGYQFDSFVKSFDKNSGLTLRNPKQAQQLYKQLLTDLDGNARAQNQVYQPTRGDGDILRYATEVKNGKDTRRKTNWMYVAQNMLLLKKTEISADDLMAFKGFYTKMLNKSSDADIKKGIQSALSQLEKKGIVTKKIKEIDHNGVPKLTTIYTLNSAPASSISPSKAENTKSTETNKVEKVAEVHNDPTKRVSIHKVTMGEKGDITVIENNSTGLKRMNYEAANAYIERRGNSGSIEVSKQILKSEIDHLNTLLAKHAPDSLEHAVLSHQKELVSRKLSLSEAENIQDIINAMDTWNKDYPIHIGNQQTSIANMQKYLREFPHDKALSMEADALGITSTWERLRTKDMVESPDVNG